MPTTTAVDTGLITLPRRADSNPRARHWLAGLLAQWHTPNDGTPELLLSEIFTNAVCHPAANSTWTTVTVAHWSGHLRITVWDPEPGFTNQAADDEHGRGLLIVQELADAFGWTRSGTGKVVWFEVGIEEA